MEKMDEPSSLFDLSKTNMLTGEAGRDIGRPAMGKGDVSTAADALYLVM